MQNTTSGSGIPSQLFANSWGTQILMENLITHPIANLSQMASADFKTSFQATGLGRKRCVSFSIFSFFNLILIRISLLKTKQHMAQHSYLSSWAVTKLQCLSQPATTNTTLCMLPSETYTIMCVERIVTVLYLLVSWQY